MSFQINNFEQYLEVYARMLRQIPKHFGRKLPVVFHWHKKWDSVLEGGFETPDVRWFSGGKLNITENCLDRHLATRANKTAIIWEPNDPNEVGVNYSSGIV